MRLGGPVFDKPESPEAWAAAICALGYSAAYCPLKEDADDATVTAYAEAAQNADLVIAEVGAWSNPLSPDPEMRRKAIDLCKARLDLAERIGARCCVNICGSRGEQWDGHHPDNLTDETLALIVDTVRDIIDTVNPKRAAYTLETMPWMYPDSVESYQRLLYAISRPAFAVHFDPVNLISSPQRYYGSGELIRDFVARLGPYIRSVHVKDITMSGKLTVHLDECRPGLGNLDHHTLLKELDPLGPDLPVMLEHLPSPEEYAAAAAHLRWVAAETGVTL
jgi:sugar phosphate isomerase/epimerase